MIASANGIACCDRTMVMIKAGGDTLDAAIGGVNIQEEDPDDRSVGSRQQFVNIAQRTVMSASGRDESRPYIPDG